MYKLYCNCIIKRKPPFHRQTKEELTLEVSKLNSSYHQWKDDESAAAEECLSLAQEVESITSGVIDVIADTLDVYSSCHCDKVVFPKIVTVLIS